MTSLHNHYRITHKGLALHGMTCIQMKIRQMAFGIFLLAKQKIAANIPAGPLQFTPSAEA